MIKYRNLPPSLRSLARAAALVTAIAPSITFAKPPYLATIEFHDGSTMTAPVEDFNFRVTGEPVAMLLLPAVQAAREAARRMQQNSCRNEEIARLILETRPGNSAVPYVKIELENVLVTSYSVSGGAGSANYNDELSLNYDRIRLQSLNRTLVSECGSGVCICDSEG